MTKAGQWLKKELQLLNLKLIKIANDYSIVVQDKHENAFIIEHWSILSNTYRRKSQEEELLK